MVKKFEFAMKMLRYICLFAVLPLVTLGQDHSTSLYCFGVDNEAVSSVGEALVSHPATKGNVISIDYPEVHFITDASGEITNEDLRSLRQIDGLSFINPVIEAANGHKLTYFNEVLVKLKDAGDLAVLEKESTELGIQIVGRNQFDSRIVKLIMPDSEMDAKIISEELKSTGLFHHVQPNYFHTIEDCAVEVDDQYFHRQWNLINEGTSAQGNGTAGADMNVTEAWEITMGSSDIKVAILDSGVDTLHPDLVDRLEPGFDGAGEGTNGFPTPNFDEDGHGTCCAGIVAATANNDEGIAGVAPNCRIVPIRVFNYINLGGVQPWAEAEWFVDGINFAWQSGCDVASNSWGIPDALLALFPGDDLLVNEAVDDAIDQGRGGLGMPMFFSSGNDGDLDSIPIWPARYHNTIAVNSTSMCDERKSLTSCDGENWEGNWGNHLDISAPGVRIPATDMSGTDGYTSAAYYYYFNGTSSACPNAAGVAALILSDFPWITAETLESIMKQSCEKVGGYDYATNTTDGTWCPELGHGRLDALAALELAPALNVHEGVENERFVSVVITSRGLQLITEFENAEQLKLDVFDLNGRSVYASTIQVSGGTQINTLALPKSATAIQLVRVSWEGGVETMKILR